MRLSGQRALVTGAAGALGRVISAALAGEGCSVAGLDLNAAGLGATGLLVEERGQRHGERIRDLDQGPHRGIALPALQIRDVATLDGCAFRKLLLRPGVLLAQRFYPQSEEPQNMGFGDRQP